MTLEMHPSFLPTLGFQAWDKFLVHRSYPQFISHEYADANIVFSHWGLPWGSNPYDRCPGSSRKWGTWFGVQARWNKLGNFKPCFHDFKFRLWIPKMSILFPWSGNFLYAYRMNCSPGWFATMLGRNMKMSTLEDYLSTGSTSMAKFLGLPQRVWMFILFIFGVMTCNTTRAMRSWLWLWLAMCLTDEHILWQPLGPYSVFGKYLGVWMGGCLVM